MAGRPAGGWAPRCVACGPGRHNALSALDCHPDSHAIRRPQRRLPRPRVGRTAPLIGWDILALVFCGWVWSAVWRLDAESTASHATREEPNREVASLVLLGAAIASLIAVGSVLFRAGSANGDLKYMEAGLAFASVFVSWTLVHTVFTLRYERLYYSGEAGGIDFNGPSADAYPVDEDGARGGQDREVLAGIVFIGH